MNTQPATPTPIIHVVVWTSAVLVLAFFGGLIAMQFSGVEPNDRVFEAFKTAGTSAMSFFFGMLVNTRVATPAPSSDKDVAVVTETKIESKTTETPKPE